MPSISLYNFRGSFGYYGYGNNYQLDYGLKSENLLNNTAFDNGLNAWVVNNTAADVVLNNGQLTNATNSDFALYLADPYDDVTQTLDPAQYTSVEQDSANGNNYDAQWAFCFDAKADTSDNYPYLTVYANSSDGSISSGLSTQISSQWGRYCAGIETYTYPSPNLAYPGSVRIVNTAQDSTGKPLGISLDNFALKRQSTSGYRSTVPFTYTSTLTAPVTLVQTNTIQTVVATVTQTNYQFLTAAPVANGAALPTVTATDKTTKTVTKKRKHNPKTITTTVAAATETVTDCTQTTLTFESKCCPSKKCDAVNDRLAAAHNRVAIPAYTQNYTRYAGYTTTINAFVVNSAVTITVPATQTAQVTQTVSIPGPNAQQAVIKILHKTYTKTITQPATVTKTAVDGEATQTVYECEDNTEANVTCPANARSAKALSQFGANALKKANKAARKADDPDVQIVCDGSSVTYQC